MSFFLRLPASAPSPRRRRFAVTAGATILTALTTLLGSVASAGTLATWSTTAATGTWNSSGNWVGSVAPTTTGTWSLVFGGTAQPLTTNNVGTVTVDSIAFTNDNTTGKTAVFTISGSSIVLSSGTITTTQAASPFSNIDGDTIASAMTLSGITTVTTGSSHSLSLTGIMSGTGGLTLGGGGGGSTIVYFGGANTYSGGTTVTGGLVQTGARTPTATTFNNSAFGSGGVTISGSGGLLVRNSSTVTNNITVSGTGMTGNAIALSSGTTGQTATVSGNVTLAGNASFGAASSASGDTTSKLVLSGTVDLGSYTATFRPSLATGAAVGLSIDVTGSVVGTGSVLLNAPTSTARLLLSGSNSYTGGTTINSGTLIVNNASALGNTAPLTVNTNGLDLNGYTATVGTLSGSSTGVVRSAIAGNARLVTNGATDSTYAGSILDGSGTVGLTKLGAGTLSLTGSSGYTGSTLVNGGVVSLGNVNAIGSSGDVGFGGGTLRFTASNTVDYSSRIKSSGSAIRLDTNGQNVSFAAGIANTNVGGLSKAGAGTLTLSGNNVYTGATSVDAGVLTLSGTIASSATTVQAGATLNGTGFLGSSLSVLASGTLTPGTGGVGRIQSSSLALAANSSTILDVVGITSGTVSLPGTAGTDYDTLVADTASGVTYGGALTISFANTNFFPTGTVIDLFQFSGTPGGFFSSILATGSGEYANLTFTQSGDGNWYTQQTPRGQFLQFTSATGDLVIVPEPSAWLMLVGCGAAALPLLRRRKRA